MDVRTRQLHAWQEGTAFFGLLFSAALALFVFGIVSADKDALLSGAGLVLTTGTGRRTAVGKLRELHRPSDSADHDTRRTGR